MQGRVHLVPVPVSVREREKLPRVQGGIRLSPWPHASGCSFLKLEGPGTSSPSSGCRVNYGGQGDILVLSDGGQGKSMVAP
jgi:hypothetical protein